MAEAKEKGNDKLTRTDAEVELLEKRLKEVEAERDEALNDREQEGLVEEAAGEGTIVDRLARVSERLHYIQRRGQMRSPMANFNYATIDQLRAAVRPALAAEGIVMVPLRTEVVRETEREYQDRNGKARTQFDTILRVTWRFACSYRPEPEGPGSRTVLGSQALDFLAWIDIPALGRSLNNSDKDINTAMTYAERNALLSVFHLESGDDPEQDRPEAEPQQQRTAPRGSQAPREWGPDGPPPSARVEPVTTEQQGEAARIRLALAPVVGGEEAVSHWIAGRCAQEFPGVRPVDYNRAQYEVILDALREQLVKIADTPEGAHLKGWDPKTGEVAEKPQEPSGEAQTSETPAEDPAGPQTPPEDAQAPVPPASPQAQAAIEQQAAEAAGLGDPPATDPDNPPGARYEEALGVAKAAGMDEAGFLRMMMEAGATKPEDLNDSTIWRLFNDRMTAAIEGGSA